MNFSTSLWTTITSDLTKPDNFKLFLKHLKDNSDIQRNALDLKSFNETIQRYQSIQDQLPPYHPYVWATRPQGQVSGFTLLLLLNISSAVVLAIGLWRLRRKVLDQAQRITSTAPENRQLIRVRRRRRQTNDPVV